MITDARDALEAWRHTPDLPSGVEPERGSFAWKRLVAESGLPVATLTRRYVISRATVYRYRTAYRGLRPAKRTSRR